VVGIGAGAGGLEAIQLLFAALPANAPAAFVICRHVQSGLSDPLSDLLCTQTAMPVLQAEAGTLLEAGHVYLVSPRERMILLKDRLSSFEPSGDDEAELAVSPIDVLLHSLAVSAGQKAIAVMLSGNDQDGLRGCASIRSHGGLVLAQHPESTEFPDMPGRVISTDIASAVATPGAMADLIWRHVGSGSLSEPAASEGSKDDVALRRIKALLAAKFAFDVQAYRPSLVAKRVRRRLDGSDVRSLLDYAALLERDDKELAALRDDLLIDVTTFFRDPEAFNALESEVVPTLVDQMSPGRPVRVWVPACATGEEAYSLAMLLLDRADQAGKTAGLEIIASDRHASALMLARAGRYHRDRLKHVPPRLAERFLRDDGDAIVVGERLRRHVTFVDHDMLGAPPPDEIDLVSCRNFLIYLAQASCQRALHACREALRPGGFLFLGASERIGTDVADLAIVHGKWRIYRKASPPPVDEALTTMVQAHRRHRAEPILPKAPSTHAERRASDPKDQVSEDDLGRVLADRQQMLEQTIDTLLFSNDTLRRKNQSLRDENHRLVHAHAALDDVATMIAHDLKAPLSIIERMAGNLHHVLSVRASDDGAMQWLQPMQMRIAALGQVIDDLLAYAREGPVDSSDRQPVDFGDLLRETLALIGLPKNVRVVITPPSLRIITWRIPLACIFRNLLGQAIERVGDRPGVIRIDAKPDGRALDIAIVDNGRHVTMRSGDLSLAIVRQLLEAVGAKLNVSVDSDKPRHEMRFTWPMEGLSKSAPAGKNAVSEADQTHADDG
jgi:chemotaxis methyl-accepting protein methylase/signal transduction histidine kinase